LQINTKKARLQEDRGSYQGRSWHELTNDETDAELDRNKSQDSRLASVFVLGGCTVAQLQAAKLHGACRLRGAIEASRQFRAKTSLWRRAVVAV